MACVGVCQSNCHKEVEEGEEEKPHQNGRIANKSLIDFSDGVLCFKCKKENAVVPVQSSNPNEGGLCLSCFHSSLFGKFKLAVTSHSMISPTDNILVAFSGGPASRVVLQFIHEMQYKAKRNLDASNDRSSPVFGVGVAFIDESAVSLVPSHKVDIAIQEIKLIVSSLAPPTKDLHITPIENIFSPDCTQGRRKLNELLHTVSDVTGKEDLLLHLRMLCLQKIALDYGYNKLVLGSCASRIACNVILATVKGQGYSLPADIQYVDARWEVPVLLPLRDCLIQELMMLCSLESLKTHQLLDYPRTGINRLVSSFVALLQEENPSREHTIVRTAEKLTSFCFNKLPETDGSDDHFPSRRRRKLQNFKSNESVQVEVFCPICNSPLSRLDLKCQKINNGNGQTRGDIFASNCCPSCCFEILPKEPSSVEHFYSLLPELMTKRVEDGIRANQSLLREQIKDCLLSDDEDGT